MAWSEEQLSNARIILQVGRELGASSRDIQIALQAAIVESGLRNLDYGDRDSIGMFQQRDAWGTREARLDPHQSARMFFLGGAAGQRGLLDLTNRGTMSTGEAAQAVQVSAFPERYGQQQSAAEGILKDFGPGAFTTESPIPIPSIPTPGTLGAVADPAALLEKAARQQATPAPTTTEVDGLGEITADSTGIGEMTFDEASGGLDELTFDNAVAQPRPTSTMDDVKLPSLEELTPTTTTTTTIDGLEQSVTAAAGGDEAWRSKIVSMARKMLGTPYVWGGTSYSGVDCSGLIKLLYGKLGFEVPRISADQARSGARVDLSGVLAGDLVAVDNSSRNNGADHIGIAIGNGLVIHAPRPGSAVQISRIEDVFGGGWGVRMTRGGA